MIVLFIGACTSCQTKELSQWKSKESEWKKHVEFVVVSRDTEDNIAGFRREKAITLPIIADRDGKVARAYNAVWVPRAYVIDSQRIIRWIQKDQAIGMTPEALLPQAMDAIGGKRSEKQ